MLRSLIRWNFMIAVWMTVGLCIAFLLTFDPSAIDQSRNVGRATIGPALIAFFEITFWFAFFRYGEGRILAALVGAILIAPAIAAYLLPQVSERSMNTVQIQLFGYLAASHLIWALFGNALWPRKATDL
jgi:hypothetical protein